MSFADEVTVNRASVAEVRGGAADGWVFKVVRSGWTISVVPRDGRGAPYEMEVTAPNGSPRYYSSHRRSIEEALRVGADVLESERVDFNRFELEKLGHAMDQP